MCVKINIRKNCYTGNDYLFFKMKKTLDMQAKVAELFIRKQSDTTILVEVT